jgi:hypothetical protein
MKNLAVIIKLIYIFIFFTGLQPLLADDETVNNTCPPGELILNINGTISGSVTDGSDTFDRYSVVAPSDGTLDLTYASDANTRVWFTTNSSNSCRNDQILSTGTSASGSLSVTAGQTIYFSTRERIGSGNTADYSFILTFTATSTNQDPSADAGADQTITVGENVTLDGSGSTDSDGNIVSYEWSTGDTGVNPVISGLAEGTHTITLTVTDDDGATDTDTVVITVEPVAGNQDPVADAGPDQTITEGGSVILDGSGSSDSDGTVTAYSWLVDGSTYTGVSPIITGLTEGTYTAVLTVTDNEGATDTDEMQITVTSSSPPADFTCANPRTFSRAYYGNLPGQVDIIGNSVVCENDGSGECTDPGNTRNNSINMMYINEDSDNSTFNHSSALLNIPADSEVRWAGLYWQGMFAGPTSDNQNNSKTIKLKIPGGSYVDVTSDSSKHNWVYLEENPDRWMYQGAADITNLIDVNDPNGWYEIANLHTATGRPAGGSFGAWSIVIVYYNKDMPIRNLTVFDGYQGIMPGGNGVNCNDRSGDPRKACLYAQNNNCPIDLASTGVANPISVPLTGFLTPKGGAVESSLGLFTGEGDRGLSGDRLSITNKSNIASFVTNGQNPINDVQNATISKNGVQVTTLEPQATLAGGTPWINSLGADIDLFDISDKLENDQSSTIVTMNTSGDGYFPGVFAFSTELYQPSLCYDYAYKQYDRYFTEDNNGSYSPRIVGTDLTTGEPITVELFIQNTEVSDISLSNVTVDIFDINTTQATYISPSTYVLPPDQVFPILNTDTDAASGHNNDIVIGDIDSQDFFYLDYDLNPLISDINMPLNIRLNYTVSFPVTVGDPITIDYETYLNSDIPLCSALNFQYVPNYGEFNVEDTALAGSESDTVGQYYNLPTQTANRPGDFKVAAYDPVNTDTRKNVSTIVAIELIDAGKYHGIDASCMEPDSALTPRIWVTFGTVADGNTSLTDFNADTIQHAIDNGLVSSDILNGTPLTTPGEFYQHVRENTAFRISYNTPGDGDILRLEPDNCVGNQVGPCYKFEPGQFPDLVALDIGAGAGNCIQDIGTGVDKIPEYCGNQGERGLDSVQLATCMECIYGYNIDFLCSRDNFAIRPESFRVKLKDQDQNDPTQQSFIALNNDISVVHDNNHANDTGHQVAAGYEYALEINATNHENEAQTPGYHASYLFDGSNGNRTFKLKWHDVANDNIYCNDTEDQNKTVTFLNGHAELNITSDQVGKYDLNLYDRLWTRVDWDPIVMTHHAGQHFLTGKDCVENSSYVPPFLSATGISGDDLTNVSGCDINSSNHLNSDTAAEYSDLPLRVHPYTFDHANVIPAAGPYTRTLGQSFVYINTPEADDKNMSYNMNGTFSAVGYDNGRLSNFVDQCYADDVNMTLFVQYQHADPTDSEPFLSYDLIDTNTTDTSIIIRPRPVVSAGEPTYRFSSTGPLSITQDEQYFVKDMNGSITMDLGYNFKRTYNEEMNPRFIQMDDFNITYVTNPTGINADLEDNFEIFGNKTLDQNITFLYGRTKPGKFFYEDIIDTSVFTPVSIVAYCDLGFTECQDRGIMAAFAGTNESDWWLSIDHNSDDSDGDIVLERGAITEGTGNPTVTPGTPNALTIITDAIDNTVSVAQGANPTLPMTVEIDFETDTTLPRFTDDWLIYNEYNNLVPSPFYKVRFIGDSNWTGIGDEGMVVGTEASRRNTKRLDW